MDLIGALSSSLGIENNKAEAVAGSVLGMIRGQVQENAGDEAATKLDHAVPQLGSWMDTAKSMLGQEPAAAAQDAPAGGLGGLFSAATSGAGGGLLGAAAGMLGGKEAQDIAKVGVLLNSLGLDASKTAMAAPLIVSFLKDKLPEGLFDKALAAAPMLSGLAGLSGAESKGGGGIAGALGGLFG